MANRSQSVELAFSEALTLPDGRKARVQAYEDGSVRFRLDGGPYVLAEAFLAGAERQAILKLSPGGQGSAAYTNWLRDQVEDGKAQGFVDKVNEYGNGWSAQIQPDNPDMPGRVCAVAVNPGQGVEIFLVWDDGSYAYPDSWMAVNGKRRKVRNKSEALKYVTGQLHP